MPTAEAEDANACPGQPNRRDPRMFDRLRLKEDWALGLRTEVRSKGKRGIASRAASGRFAPYEGDNDDTLPRI
jgi:hypothetical protein